MKPSVDPERYLEVLQPDRCPLCFLIQDYGHEHLRSVLEESVTDPSTRQTLFESKGFCRRHAWKAVHQSHPLGLAVIYASLLEKGIEDLSTGGKLWGKPRSCPICESEKKREQSFIQQFALSWDRSEALRKAFSERGILCLRHLERVLKEKMSSTQLKNLRETGKKALETLLKDLNEFLEKQDYHRSHESFGKERDAWVRVVRMVSGEQE
jgi:Family of unknown function (DUF6062)